MRLSGLLSGRRFGTTMNREGASKDASAIDPYQLFDAGARWNSAARAADSDVAAAGREVERAAGEILDRRRREVIDGS